MIMLKLYNCRSNKISQKLIVQNTGISASCFMDSSANRPYAPIVKAISLLRMKRSFIPGSIFKNDIISLDNTILPSSLILTHE